MYRLCNQIKKLVPKVNGNKRISNTIPIRTATPPKTIPVMAIPLEPLFPIKPTIPVITAARETMYIGLQQHRETMPQTNAAIAQPFFLGLGSTSTNSLKSPIMLSSFLYFVLPSGAIRL